MDETLRIGRQNGLEFETIRHDGGGLMHGFAQFGIGMYRILDLGQAKTGR